MSQHPEDCVCMICAPLPMKTDGQNALSDLEAVLCNPEGKAAIRGSKEDLAVINRSLETLRSSSNPDLNKAYDCLLAAKRVSRKKGMNGYVRQYIDEALMYLGLGNHPDKKNREGEAT